jgi:hypothetical protein
LLGLTKREKSRLIGLSFERDRKIRLIGEEGQASRKGREKLARMKDYTTRVVRAEELIKGLGVSSRADKPAAEWTCVLSQEWGSDGVAN